MIKAPSDNDHEVDRVYNKHAKPWNVNLKKIKLFKCYFKTEGDRTCGVFGTGYIIYSDWVLIFFNSIVEHWFSPHWKNF